MQRKIFELAFALSGAGTTTTNFDAYDLSRSFENKSELIVTSAATLVGDTLDVKFQETEDGVQWNTRMRHTAQVGNSGASTTQPESEILTILSLGPFVTADAIREPTGSKGAAELTAPGVINGFLTGRRPLRAATYRVTMILTGASAAFSGTYMFWIDSDI